MYEREGVAEVLLDEREGVLWYEERVVVAEDVRVAEVLDDERVGAATLLRVVVVLAVREAVVAAVREGVEAVRVVTEALLLLREDVAAALRVEAAVLRVAAVLLVRILLLPKEREAAPCADALRVVAPATALREDVPCPTAARVAARRSASKARALVAPRAALRVENERSGWRAA